MSFSLHDASTWPATAKPDPEYEEAVKAMGGAPDLGLFPDIPSMRQFIENAKANAAAATGPTPGVKEEDRQITMRDGNQITVRIHSPEKSPSGGSPLAVMYHGGGWCIGGLDSEEVLCRLMVSNFGIVVVNVDYRLGPEHKFPTAHNDCYDATKWAATNASSLGANPSLGFIIGGTSAGGNITATISHLWRDNYESPALTGCHLMIPTVCANDFHSSIPSQQDQKDLTSWSQLEHAPILSHKATSLFKDNFIPNISDRKDPLFSPYLWESGHKGLPKQYFQVCGMDPLRDEALIYERHLREHDGVETKVDMYPGVPHGYWGMMPQLSLSQKFVKDSVEGVRWLLGK